MRRACGLRAAPFSQAFDIRQLTDVSHCNLQQYLSRNLRRAFHYLLGPFPGAAVQRLRAARLLQPPLRNPMTTMAPTRPTEPRACRIRLTAGAGDRRFYRG